MEKGIKKQVDNFSRSKEARRAIQEIQKTFKCCGVRGPNDYTNGYPSSCCGKTSFGTEYDDKCPSGETPEYQDGCGEKVKNTLTKYLGGIAGVVIALILVQLLIIVSACCLSREVRN